MSAERPFLKKDFSDVVQDLINGLRREREGGRSALTDTTEGSVVRTLVEAFAHELAVSYEQLERVYKLGYLETAEGVGLDNVVALLSVERRPPGSVEGAVTFSRALSAPFDISIPGGTLVAGPEAPLFETVDEAALLQGNTQVTVNVRSVKPWQEVVDAKTLSVMPRPILGIETVTNLTDLLPRQRQETDDELRERARRTTLRSNVGTVAALEQAVASLGFSDIRIQERIPEVPGQVEVIVGDPKAWNEEGMQRVSEAVELARPAGIKVTIRGVTRISVDVTATLVLDLERPEHERSAIESDIREELAGYFSELGVNDNVRLIKVRNILAGNDSVMDVGRTGAINYLEPWGKDEDQRMHMATTHLLNNGDIFVGSAEKAYLEVVGLKLEPPALDLWVDVNLPEQQTTEGLEEAIRKTLNEYFLEVLGEELILFDDLTERLRQVLVFTSVQFTMIHDRDGRVLEMSDANDEDELDHRERPQVRFITFGGGTSG